MWLPPFKFIAGFLATEEVDTNISKLDGSVYSGPYFKTSNGDIYSGEFPSADSERLIENFSEVANREQLGFEEINFQDINSDIESDIPYPTPSDYKKGFFVRYFLKDSRTKKIVEVKKPTYIKQLEKVYIIGTKVRWILDKPVKDIFNSGYLFKGAATRNRENILKASSEMIGLDTYVVDYAQFADIESDVEGVPFEDLSQADQVRLIKKVQPINIDPPVRTIKPRFKEEKIITKSRSNLYTNGNRYKLAGTSTPYIGFYHIHPTKGAMVGAVHVSESHSRLIPLSGGSALVDDLTTQRLTEFTQTTVSSTSPGTSLTDGGGGSYSGGSNSGGGGSSGGGGGGYSGGGESGGY